MCLCQDPKTKRSGTTLRYFASAHLVVLRLPTPAFIVCHFPLFILGHGVEADLLLALPDLDDRRNKFDEEFGYPKEGWVEVVEEIDDESFDV